MYDVYRKKLIEMAESVLKWMRWSAFFFLRNEDEEDECGDGMHYGFDSRRCPPQIDELNSFEDDMAKLIESVEFRRPRDNFQNTLQNDIARIRDSQAVFVPADKTRNLHRMGKTQYEKLLRENITRHYKAGDEDAYDEINVEAQVIASELGIADRMNVIAKREAFITLKDHKENFENSLPVHSSIQ